MTNLPIANMIRRGVPLCTWADWSQEVMADETTTRST
jgi:hypothetical protein